MFKNVKNAWSDWFKGTTITPIKTTLKHPVCSIIWVMICLLPSLIYFGVYYGSKEWTLNEYDKYVEQKKKQNSYRSYDNE